MCRTSLGLEFSPELCVQFLTQQKTFDIVLAHHSEPPDEVRQQIQTLKSIPAIASLAPRVILYTKGLAPDSTYQQQERLNQELDADILRTLPNVGREGDTYLAHIVGTTTSWLDIHCLHKRKWSLSSWPRSGYNIALPIVYRP